MVMLECQLAQMDLDADPLPPGAFGIQQWLECTPTVEGRVARWRAIRWLFRSCIRKLRPRLPRTARQLLLDCLVLQPAVAVRKPSTKRVSAHPFIEELAQHFVVGIQVAGCFLPSTCLDLCTVSDFEEMLICIKIFA